MEEFKRYLRSVGIKYDENKKASEFTSFRIGGECFAVYPGNEAQTVDVIRRCHADGMKYITIGCGSNVLFPDEGYDGAVIFTAKNDRIICDGDRITAGSGAKLNAVCREALDHGLSGLEFAYGIPDSVGGAVFMNAGAYGGEIKDVVVNVRAYSPEDDSIISFSGEECGFGYRESRFKDSSLLILSAEFLLTDGDRTEIKEKMDDLMQRRISKQPLNYPSAGSVFKRYPGRYTGQMIEEAGLKGYRVGGAEVSEKHAGFIVNKGGATAKDVTELISHIKEVIRSREGIDLECEIRIIK